MAMAMVGWIPLLISQFQHWMELGHSEMNGMEKMSTFSYSNTPIHQEMETMQTGQRARAQ